MIERFEEDTPHRQDVRDRLLDLERRERIEEVRARRRHHRPDAALVWLVLVVLAVIVVTCARRP